MTINTGTYAIDVEAYAIDTGRLGKHCDCVAINTKAYATDTARFAKHCDCVAIDAGRFAQDAYAFAIYARSKVQKLFRAFTYFCVKTFPITNLKN